MAVTLYCRLAVVPYRFGPFSRIFSARSCKLCGVAEWLASRMLDPRAVRSNPGVTCSKRKRSDPVSMSVTFSARLGACSKRQAC